MRLGNSYTIQEIGEGLAVPQLQRGLVWRPRQIELLWDSILRGFPIGAFVVADFADKTSKSDIQLLDGQQRMNAIKLGFINHSEYSRDIEESRGFLWLDLMPKLKEQSSRKFWIRICTPAHPWGYRANDNCSYLSAGEKRQACELYQADCGDNKHDFRNAWPFDAHMPVPLSIFVKAGLCAYNENEFITSISRDLNAFANLNKPWKTEIFEQHDIMTAIKNDNLIKAFSTLKSYRVNIVEVPHLFDSESPLNQTTEIECLFERMNTLGTPISHRRSNHSLS